jgi:hypothetical protein
MLDARFVEITVPEPDVVYFTLESRAGIRASFKQRGFNDFAARAIDLVAPGQQIKDTDELLNRWFSFDSITF